MVDLRLSGGSSEASRELTARYGSHPSANWQLMPSKPGLRASTASSRLTWAHAVRVPWPCEARLGRRWGLVRRGHVALDGGLEFGFGGGPVGPAFGLDPLAGLQVLVAGEEVLDFLDQEFVDVA